VVDAESRVVGDVSHHASHATDIWSRRPSDADCGWTALDPRTRPPRRHADVAVEVPRAGAGGARPFLAAFMAAYF